VARCWSSGATWRLLRPWKVAVVCGGEDADNLGEVGQIDRSLGPARRDGCWAGARRTNVDALLIAL
jgi:hypothetical protein